MAKEIRRELAQQQGGCVPGAALTGSEAAEAAPARGLLPRAVRDLDRALGDASPTKIAAVGDELPQVSSCSSAYGQALY